MLHNLIKLADDLDKKKKFHDSDTVIEYLMNLADEKFKKLHSGENQFKKHDQKDEEDEEPISQETAEKYLSDLRNSFIDFLTDVVIKDYKKEKHTESLTPNELVEFYFNNRENYENQLDDYDLMLGQTEGIISDDDFVDQLSDDDLINDDGAMIREGK